MTNYIEPIAPTQQNVQCVSEIPVIIQECFLGKLNHIARPPREREFVDLVQFGNVYVYEKHSSGIQKWLDGLRWPYNRVVGEFTIETSPVADAAVWGKHPVPHSIARITRVKIHRNTEHRAIFYVKYDESVLLGAEITGLDSFSMRSRL